MGAPRGNKNAAGRRKPYGITKTNYNKPSQRRKILGNIDYTGYNSKKISNPTARKTVKKIKFLKNYFQSIDRNRLKKFK